jgi:uncharacterized protein (UPF0332 family)
MTHRTFEPKTFYDLAVHVQDQLLNTLPAELKQAANRTCISRAYYAVFLLLREKILALSIRDPSLRKRIERSNDAHAIVAESIRRVDFDVGDYLVNLRGMRNRADYRTNIAVLPGDVTYAFKITNEISNKSTAIVNQLTESDVVLAWDKIQKEREKRRAFQG